MGTYVDGFVIAVPKKSIAAYKRLAQRAGKIWMKHGALGYYECVGDDLNPQWTGIRFPSMVKAKGNETVVFSFILYKSRAHRDRVNAKVMKDPFMTDPKNTTMPFDAKRMAYGGFKTIVQY